MDVEILFSEIALYSNILLKALDMISISSRRCLNNQAIHRLLKKDGFVRRSVKRAAGLLQVGMLHWILGAISGQESRQERKCDSLIQNAIFYCRPSKAKVWFSCFERADIPTAELLDVEIFRMNKRMNSRHHHRILVMGVYYGLRPRKK